MQWFIKSFDQMTPFEVYQIIQLRVDVFVVEQNCPYSELDGKDLAKAALHLFAIEDSEVACYLRALPPGVSYENMPSLGRIVANPNHRGSGIGHELMKRATQIIDEKWPTLSCHISAQSHLQGYYNQHGFSAVGEGYLEDGILHIGMERPAVD
jgi:ElaA protein